MLLVDDEVRVVDGLKKALYQYRERWSVSAVTSARAALVELENGFDAVITDTRMPDMDGAALLREVAERWPATLRVVLTGDVGKANMERVQPLTHHFVPKPARAPTLFARIEESLEARDRLETPALKDLVYRLGTLPALPGTFAAINRLAESPAATVDDFVRALEADPAVCGNVLRAVNSAWFGLSRRVSTLKEAIALLGVRPLRSLVLTTELFGASGTFVERLRQRALERVAAMPKLTARAHATHLQDEATTAAVLADVGQLLFSLRIPEESTALYADPLATGRDRSEAERRLFGADHATVGAVLLRLWNLPPALVDAVALHHQPRTTPTADLGALVALAVKLQELGWARPEAARTLREEAGELAAAFGVSDLDGLRAACFPG